MSATLTQISRQVSRARLELTPDEEFAYRWAGKDAIVNVYELNLEGLEIEHLERDQKWYSYIYRNRRAEDTCDADVVIGPIANDTIYDTMGILTSGYVQPDQSLKLLQIGPQYYQVALKSEKAKANLRWVDAKRMKQGKEDILKIEQENYQRLLAEEMLRWEEET
ncbi:Protein of unknown function [Lachnospiraceae bacterium C10]|nr:Protein of unknown function [Lachnospiraceae bacterium C10]